ncbi:MAG: xanthine dehydrogenase family protein molybdopterin-binding subunit [Sphaerochaetaceae bacterium]|nr:xanthine dehydrogenase family protein molybdopterin-binding subunit [Sphaerochaetaceae bacterium]
MAVTHITDSMKRVDAYEKARGEAKYLCDFRLPGMLYARMIRSTIPRGRILSVDVPELPSDYYYISAKDIPEGGKNALHMIAEDYRCFADGDVKFIGETIGILVGRDRGLLYELEKQVVVNYEELPAVTTIDEALEKKAIINGEDNIMCKLECEMGPDVDEALKNADRIIEETFETGYHEHVHLETNSVACDYEDGKFIIYASAQCPFYIRTSIACTMGMKPEDIIVRQMTTGGAFGGKEHFPDVLAGPLIVACNKIRKPIFMIFDREEDMEFSVKRHPSRTVFRTGVDKQGNILGTDIKIYYNAGAYLTSSYVVLQRGVFHSTGVYRFPCARAWGYGVATNCFPTCAFRGFGAPQTLYAIEMHLDHIAREYGYDPAEYKRKYFLKQGEETITQGHIVEKVVLEEMMKQITDASDYYRKVKEYKIGSGKGIGISFYNHGGAFTGNGEQAIIKAKLKLRKEGDKVYILCGSTEMGQGFRSIMRKIVSDTIGIDIDNVFYNNPDTSKVVDSGPTAASRSTMVVGFLCEKAAKEMKERWEEGDFEVVKQYEHPEGHPWDQTTFRGDAYLGYGWGACVVEVEVDKITKEVTTKGIWSSHDIGRPIDKLIVHGQVNGGIVQSLGYAALEKMECKNGRFKQRSMSSYIIPTSMDFPHQEWFLVDNPYPWGPYGAKGMGELVFNGADAAYMGAVERAIGRDTFKIPMPPEDIQGVIDRK